MILHDYIGSYCAFSLCKYPPRSSCLSRLLPLLHFRYCRCSNLQLSCSRAGSSKYCRCPRRRHPPHSLRLSLPPQLPSSLFLFFFSSLLLPLLLLFLPPSPLFLSFVSSLFLFPLLLRTPCPFYPILPILSLPFS